MTSSTVLNTELTAIRAIIPAEWASVHWLYAERQCVCEFMCLRRLTVRMESCCIVQIMKLDLWPLTVSFTGVSGEEWRAELHNFAYM